MAFDRSFNHVLCHSHCQFPDLSTTCMSTLYAMAFPRGRDQLILLIQTELCLADFPDFTYDFFNKYLRPANGRLPDISAKVKSIGLRDGMAISISFTFFLSLSFSPFSSKGLL